MAPKTTDEKKKQLAKRLKEAKEAPGDNGESGVIYVGRIPHGFHEQEMRSYFSQFGEVNRLRLSRNKQTGASKHYAFVEFASGEVAKIVADTMNNYLMFGHILKCSVVPREQVHDRLWVGANRRFKKVPWAKIESRKLGLGKGRTEWTRKIEVEKRRRSAKSAKLREIGYEFEAPELKGVDTVPVKETAAVEPSKQLEHELAGS